MAKSPHYHWSSITFATRLPVIEIHTSKKEHGRLGFRTTAEFHELVMTLKGALTAIRREEARTRKRRQKRFTALDPHAVCLPGDRDY